jgi:hypothetical protein
MMVIRRRQGQSDLDRTVGVVRRTREPCIHFRSRRGRCRGQIEVGNLIELKKNKRVFVKLDVLSCVLLLIYNFES